MSQSTAYRLPDFPDKPETEQAILAIKYEMRAYAYVFISLLFLTGLTIGVWALHLPQPYAAILAVAIATIKVSLVVCFFMHLLSERWLIVLVIGLASIHMVGLTIGTFLTEWETARTISEPGGHYISEIKELFQKK